MNRLTQLISRKAGLTGLIMGAVFVAVAAGASAHTVRGPHHQAPHHRAPHRTAPHHRSPHHQHRGRVTTIWASPNGGGIACTQMRPCTITRAVAKASNHDTVIAKRGVYHGGVVINKSLIIIKNKPYFYKVI